MTYEPFDHFWLVGGDETRVFSSAAGDYLPVDNARYVDWLAAGEIPTLIADESTLWEVLNAQAPQAVPEAYRPKRRVPKSTIIARLADAQLDAAMAAMTTRQQERWRAPDQPSVYFDDPETIAVLTAVGADPEEVLAP